ncbi:hypothetical protein HPB48_003460 [Haemaphysalis longicornis]|uniref:C2H2-type domain-containing protein n=1 Tax=Haemaphysalis longicornis TaxID=44386 RepID=A0A9J6GGM6_HAELO|nr:hypothetical protein HPB48_003460 [Haemaphysalis longicornis]
MNSIPLADEDAQDESETSACSSAVGAQSIESIPSTYTNGSSSPAALAEPCIMDYPGSLKVHRGKHNTKALVAIAGCLRADFSLTALDPDMSPDEAEEKARLISQVLELQNTLDDLSQRVDSVKEENLKLKSENQVLGQYIENLMSASSVFQSTSPKAKKKPFECPHPGCGKKYTRQFHLTRHLKQSHESPKEPSSEPLKCTQEGCGKLFSSQNALYKHTKYSHQKRKFKARPLPSSWSFASLQCEHCPKTFVKHQHLKVHGFEHTAVLPYPCPEPGCSKAFLLPSRLRAHQRTHRGYACDVQGCEEVFTKWTLLRKHRKVDHQRRFSCDACGREFFSKWNLKVHAETHGEQEEGSLYCCPHEGCSRFYSHAKNLRQHLASAHENRRFPCDVPGCSRTFFAKVTSAFSSTRRPVRGLSSCAGSLVPS